METLAQDEAKRTLKVDQVPASIIRAVRVKAARDESTVRAVVIEALRVATAEGTSANANAT